ncbi:LPS export ABC transporter permease LptF [Alginatibacterium sediminis]|uniref:Lipopolysaccharide export system permease protein LptF n=1 Tax=Alginatibacterium sediminis TaxID=2164068 RepID=A0A420EDA7_9ALTE|nr:LPS export ABC transporter permease LptF [Alginatibacterium sediminis]RKF18655.1 LPS export ABC transporter permease LptF [Alginatibacterium sediminis]
MLIFRYLFRETFKTQLAVTAVLLLIFMSQKFVQIISQAAEGNIPGAIVAKLVIYNIPTYMVLIVPISLFIGVLFTHGRLYAESEMTVMHACGYSNAQVLRDTMVLGILTTVLAFANSLYISPYFHQLEHKMVDEANAETGVASILPGRFENLGNGVVAFIQEIEHKGEKLNKVFISHAGQGETRPSIVIADRGGLKSELDGSAWLHLEDGTRYEGTKQGLDQTITTFAKYSIEVKERATQNRNLGFYAMSTNELWASDDIRAISELQWRISLPLSIPILTLLVVPLSVVNHRQGRYAKLVPAILLYLSYYLLMSAAKSALQDGAIPPSVGIWSVHVLMLTIALSYLFLRSEKYLVIRARWVGRKNV